MSNLLAHKSVRIKKGTHGSLPDKATGEVGPVDVLIDRSQQWKHVTKSLLHYYKGLSALESTTAKATLALCDTIQVPFHEGHYFMGDGGFQEVLYEVRDNNKALAENHSLFAGRIDEGVVRDLEAVRTEIKSHIAAIEKEAGVLATEVAKERASSAALLTHLQSGIEVFETSQTHMLAKDDPYLTHRYTATQLAKQVHKENDLQGSLIRFQQQQPSYEAGLVKSIQLACHKFDEAKKTQQEELAKLQAATAASLQRVAPDAEYNFYASHEGAVLDPNTPYRQTDAITFPGHEHPATVPIKEGTLERKKRWTKAYKEAHYVLSASGYLHERRTTDDANATRPPFSLFLPECSLGTPAGPNDKSHKFHVEGNKAIKSSFEGKMKQSLRFGGKEIAYSFRARTNNEMLGWWGEMDKLSRDTKSSSSVISSGGKNNAIASAVANIGYAAPEAEHASTPVAPTTKEAVTINTPTTGASTTLPSAIPVEHETIAAREAAQAEAEDEDEGDYSDDESGGSSAEEEELARTAPSTPFVSSEGTESPLDVAGQKHATTAAETLPTYTGDGTHVAEKEALVEKGKPGFLGSLFGSSSSAEPSGSS
ncbi:hypothetical protein RQP46_007287 [Phenoliferia psychrophenolica]